MAFSASEIAEHTALIERLFWSQHRPPLHLRDKIREGQRFTGHSIELFFVRPRFDDPTRTVEESIAKLQFVRTTDLWRICWKRADWKWYRYSPRPEVGSLAGALRVINMTPTPASSADPSSEPGPPPVRARLSAFSAANLLRPPTSDLRHLAPGRPSSYPCPSVQSVAPLFLFASLVWFVGNLPDI